MLLVGDSDPVVEGVLVLDNYDPSNSEYFKYISATFKVSWSNTIAMTGKL